MANIGLGQSSCCVCTTVHCTYSQACILIVYGKKNCPGQQARTVVLYIENWKENCPGQQQARTVPGQSGAWVPSAFPHCCCLARPSQNIHTLLSPGAGQSGYQAIKRSKCLWSKCFGILDIICIIISAPTTDNNIRSKPKHPHSGTR